MLHPKYGCKMKQCCDKWTLSLEHGTPNMQPASKFFGTVCSGGWCSIFGGGEVAKPHANPPPRRAIVSPSASALHLPHLGRRQRFLFVGFTLSLLLLGFMVASPASSSTANTITSPLSQLGHGTRFLISREENQEDSSEYQFVIVTQLGGPRVHTFLKPIALRP